MARSDSITQYFKPGTPTASGVTFYSTTDTTIAGLVEATLNWETTSQSIENNSSTVQYSVSLKPLNLNKLSASYVYDPFTYMVVGTDDKAATATNTYPDIAITVDNTELYTTRDFTATAREGESCAIYTGTATIVHSTDGTKSATLGINIRIKNFYTDNGDTWYKYNNDVDMSGLIKLSATLNLDAIPKHALIKSATDFTDEAPPTITYIVPPGVTNVQACISFTGGNDDVAYRAIPAVTNGSYTFVFSTADKLALWSILDQGLKSTSMRIYIRSEFNGTPYYEYKPAILTIKEYEPVLSPTVVDTNSKTLALTGNQNILVRYASTASFNSYAVARKGASIDSQFVKNGEVQLLHSGSGTIEGPTSNTFYFSVTDNREDTTKDVKVFSIENGYFVEYVKPTVSASVGTMTATGEVDVTIRGKYYDGSFGKEDNALTVSYTLSENNGDPTQHTIGEVIPTMSGNDGNDYTYTFTIPELNYLSVYEVSIQVADKILTEGTITNVVLASTPVFDWSNEDFNFNVPVNLGGGFSYPQRMIWSGASQLGANDVITLEGDDVISKQPSGIVLVFSLYRDGAAEDASIHSFFISKVEANTLLSNAPHTFMLGINSNLSVFGSKYVYISDTQIKGFSDNAASGTAKCGITFDNSKFVLRYILGV